MVARINLKQNIIYSIKSIVGDNISLRSSGNEVKQRIIES